MIDPWKSDVVEDYRKTMEEFGIDRFEIGEMPEDPRPPRLFNQGIVFGQRGFPAVNRRINRGDPFAIMTGLMPSGRMHLGHKMVIDQILYFQKFGARVFVGVADLEAYATRNMSLENARELALESYIKNYLALGLGQDGLEIYFQSKRREVKDLAVLLGRKVNLSTMRAIYGFTDQTNMAHMHAPLIQAGDILHPQIKLGPIPVVVPVGIDQDPHMRLCRDLSASFRMFNATQTSDGKIGVFVKLDEKVEPLLNKARDKLRETGFLDFKMIPKYKALYIPGASQSDVPFIDETLAELEAEEGGYGFIPPASTYNRFMRGLTGEKMSSSKPDTAVFLDDDPSDAERKMKKAVTGGRETAEEQRKLGGRPEACAVFDTMLYHTVGDDDHITRIEEECRNGDRLCGGCKSEAIELLSEFLKDLADRKDENEHLVSSFVRDD
ncbi:MAG: tryptophan--tRNA ligase [Thermoplasmatota archaeon]